ncbi:MAG: polyprenyl synthetase family protein, partial [Deltaproteobacteria bacterium]|nr:polyprenyl synthetase family protein [Deltaproteobacteria bacterium]
HDDLPCMDNDDYRRGRETVHKKYSVAIGLLTGDALLTDAFGIIAGASEVSDSVKCRLIHLISQYTGSSGMIGGQVLDIDSQTNKKMTDYHRLIKLKTANMFILSSLAGAICSGKEFREEEIINFGENFGLIFQLTDDILDYRQDKKGSFNTVELEGFSEVFRQIDTSYAHILKFIDSADFNLGIIRGITDIVIKRVENIRNAEVSF